MTEYNQHNDAATARYLTLFTRAFHSYPDNSVIGFKSLVFELTASLGLPAAIIHTVVHTSEHILHTYTLPYSSPNPVVPTSSVGNCSISTACARNKLHLPTAVRSFTPTLLGLLCLPLLPSVSTNTSTTITSIANYLEATWDI